jgi:hypothetical protein
VIQPGFRVVLAAILLLAFGIGYDRIIAQMERRGYIEGFRWLAMGAAAMVTLAIMAIIDWRGAALAAGAFFISGLPMALGEMWRYVRAREREQHYVRQTETLAE